MLKGKAKADYMRKYRTPYMREYRKRVETPVESPEKIVETLSLPVRTIPDALAKSNAKFKKWKSK